MMASPLQETAETGAGAQDLAWDEFLSRSRLGHFQQSDLWARLKRHEGWDAVRSVDQSEGQIRGGFQMLIKRTRLGRVGLVLKGPVAESTVEHGERLVRTARENNLAALIVQLPDEAKSAAALSGGFEPCGFSGLIDASYWIDVHEGPEAVEAAMNRTMRRNVRQAVQRGARVIEGDEKDLDCFFDLMRMTCERQKTRPNPATPELLRKLWMAFCKRRGTRLIFAEVEGRKVCGILCLGWGDVLAIWKKGWDGTCEDRHPNRFLYHDVLMTAARQGFRRCDCVAMDRKLSSKLLAGSSNPEQGGRGRDLIHLGMGGYPVLLPTPLIWFRNPAIRAVYRWGTALMRGIRGSSEAGELAKGDER